MVKLKVSKSVLIGIGAFLWAFAAYRILKIGSIDIENNALHTGVDYFIGVMGAIPFFIFVFLKVSRKYIKRIIHLPKEKSHVFSFMSLKGYLMMTFMMTLGILSRHFDLISPEYKGIFYISLGLSLLSSSVYYIFHGVMFRLEKNKEQ